MVKQHVNRRQPRRMRNWGLPRFRPAPLLLAAALLAAAGPASAEPPGAASCTGCHVRGGGVGLLGGRPAPDTVRMLEDYRSGRLPATVMNRIVRGFTPDEVVALSLWFAAEPGLRQ